jgi:hypothetical protein
VTEMKNPRDGDFLFLCRVYVAWFHAHPGRIKLQQVTAPSAFANSETSTVVTLLPAASSFAHVFGNVVG